jgi:hypothetical protein
VDGEVGPARRERPLTQAQEGGEVGSDAGAALHLRLQARRAEIEQAFLTRVYGIADPTAITDLSYVDGLRVAASAALDFGLATLESSGDRQPFIPAPLLSQARLAARHGVGIDTVLRRYTAGYALLVDFLAEEVERDVALPTSELRRLLAASSSALDRLLAHVSEEHTRELERRLNFSEERRRTERLERLLAGEPVDVSDIPYDFDRWHVGIAVQGAEARDHVREVSATLGSRRLFVVKEDERVWAWLGFREAPDLAEVMAAIDPGGEEFVALGEPADGLAGWRLTHRQALAALPIALRGGEQVVRYTDVALVAAVLENELAATSLRRLYLDPLTAERDGGETLRRTLSAYFATERNTSSAAALLGVTRRTITNRLRSAEKALCGPVKANAVELQTALQMAELEDSAGIQALSPLGPPHRPVRNLRT